MKTKVTVAAAIITGNMALGLGAWAHIQPDSAPAPSAPRKALVVPPGTGMKAGRGEWKILSGQSNGALALAEINADDSALGTGPGPGHVHTQEEEAWYVIEGELTFEVGGETVPAGPGTFVWAPRNIPHTFRYTKTPARYLLMLCPAGFEQFFFDREALQKKGIQKGTPEHRAAMRGLFQKYGAGPAAEFAPSDLDPAAPRRALVVPPGAGKMVGMMGNRGEWKITSTQSNGALALCETNVPASALVTGPKPHIHTREDEAWYVIDGEVTFEVGGETNTARPGTFVWAPRNVPHGFRYTKLPARYLLLVCPAGFERFFFEWDELRKKRVQPGTPEFDAAGRGLPEKYGARLLTEPEDPKP